MPPGQYRLVFSLINFAAVHGAISASPAGATATRRCRAALRAQRRRHRDRQADVHESRGRRAAPAEDLVGIAQSSSQGAITARQLDARPIMRSGEVLETVPGVVISQHSGEGKANQYYLRGFNLDHGTDFATTVAGMPVNMPTNGHGQGYSDLNFLIPELVSGVQYSEGPVLRRPGRLRDRRLGEHQLRQRARRADRASRGRRRRVRPRAGRRVAEGRRAGTCSARSKSSTTTARGIEPDDYRRS